MIIAIVGPTGVGKSALAMKLAEQVHGEIVNGDAFQIYRSMNIGTAKPSEAERKKIPHHLYDFIDPDVGYSVFDYQRDLRAKLDELNARSIPPILVGGTGLYLKAALYDFDLEAEEKKIDLSGYAAYSNEELHAVLAELDYAESLKIHPNNRKRVMRAIEICLSRGKKKSEIVAGQEHRLLYPVTFVGLTCPREKLYAIIDRRVDRMFESGLIDEVRGLRERYPDSLRAFQAIGYKEVIEGLKNGEDEATLRETIKRNSRRYAKRQYTYFSHQMEVNWFESPEEALDFALKEMQRS